MCNFLECDRCKEQFIFDSECINPLLAINDLNDDCLNNCPNIVIDIVEECGKTRNVFYIFDTFDL